MSPKPTEQGPRDTRQKAWEAESGPWWKRVVWFVGLWCSSLVVLSVVAYGIRAMIMP